MPSDACRTLWPMSRLPASSQRTAPRPSTSRQKDEALHMVTQRPGFPKGLGPPVLLKEVERVRLKKYQLLDPLVQEKGRLQSN